MTYDVADLTKFLNSRGGIVAPISGCTTLDEVRTHVTLLVWWGHYAMVCLYSGRVSSTDAVKFAQALITECKASNVNVVEASAQIAKLADFPANAQCRLCAPIVSSMIGSLAVAPEGSAAHQRLRTLIIQNLPFETLLAWTPPIPEPTPPTDA